MRSWTIKLVLLTLSVAFVNIALAQTKYSVQDFSVQIKGTSNLHDWTADTKKATGSFLIQQEGNELKDIQSLQVVVDATSLKGSKGSIMDDKIADALNSKKHPKITYTLTKVNSFTSEGSGYKVSTTGTLTISGVTQNVTINATGKLLPNGAIEFTGEKALKMTSFKVEPPTAMFGAMKTGDEVTIDFKVVIKQQ